MVLTLSLLDVNNYSIQTSTVKKQYNILLIEIFCEISVGKRNGPAVIMSPKYVV